MVDLINTLGYIFQNGKFFMQQTAKVTRVTVDQLLGAAAREIIKRGGEKLQELYRKTRRSLVILAISMLSCAAIIAILMPKLKSWGLIFAALINYAVIGLVIFHIVRLVISLMPYKELIAFLLPVFWNNLRKTKSFKGAVKKTIRAAVRRYIVKAPPAVKKIHTAGSILGMFPNLDEIETKVSEDFYPLVCRCLRVLVLYNVLLFAVGYSLFIFIVKYFVLTGSNSGILDLYIYPFRYINTVITGQA